MTPVYVRGPSISAFETGRHIQQNLDDANRAVICKSEGGNKY